MTDGEWDAFAEIPPAVLQGYTAGQYLKRILKHMNMAGFEIVHREGDRFWLKREVTNA